MEIMNSFRTTLKILISVAIKLYFRGMRRHFNMFAVVCTGTPQVGL